MTNLDGIIGDVIFLSFGDITGLKISESQNPQGISY